MKKTDPLTLVRMYMKQQKIQAIVIPTADPHLCEYSPLHWRLRAALSGFDGSAGTLVVTSAKALLWTDFRYWISAEIQLRGRGIELQKTGAPGVDSWQIWLQKNLKKGSAVGIDPMMISAAGFKTLSELLSENGIALSAQKELCSALWPERPLAPHEKIRDFPLRYAGLTRAEKLAKVRGIMTGKGADFYLISTLPEIAWLLNLRGNDTPNTPLFFAFALVGQKEVSLFADITRFPKSLLQKLAADGIHIKSYESITTVLAGFKKQSLLWVPSQTPKAVADAIAETVKNIHVDEDPVHGLKALKNKSEIAALRKAAVTDGVMLTLFFATLESYLEEGVKITEYDAANLMTAIRKTYSDGNSFDPIVGYNANAAQCHYKPEPETALCLKRKGLLLVDSGSQGAGATTDVTRTVALGAVPDQARMDYTCVLKAHLALNRACFPKNATAAQLDGIVRQPLWEAGLDFGHGTGHGVGSNLGVHEGPYGISGGSVRKFEPGVLITNEPGLYRSGKYGIRIENMLLTVPGPKNEFASFLTFEQMTFFPYDRKLIDKTLLTTVEIEQINAYHRVVFEKLSPHIPPELLPWLEAQTELLSY